MQKIIYRRQFYITGALEKEKGIILSGAGAVADRRRQLRLPISSMRIRDETTPLLILGCWSWNSRNSFFPGTSEKIFPGREFPFFSRIIQPLLSTWKRLHYLWCYYHYLYYASSPGEGIIIPGFEWFVNLIFFKSSDFGTVFSFSDPPRRPLSFSTCLNKRLSTRIITSLELSY